MKNWRISVKGGYRLLKDNLVGLTPIYIDAESEQEALDKFISQLVIGQFNPSDWPTKCKECGYDTLLMKFQCDICGTMWKK